MRIDAIRFEPQRHRSLAPLDCEEEQQEKQRAKAPCSAAFSALGAATTFRRRTIRFVTGASAASNRATGRHALEAYKTNCTTRSAACGGSRRLYLEHSRPQMRRSDMAASPRRTTKSVTRAHRDAARCAGLRKWTESILLLTARERAVSPSDASKRRPSIAKRRATSRHHFRGARMDRTILLATNDSRQTRRRFSNGDPEDRRRLSTRQRGVAAPWIEFDSGVFPRALFAIKLTSSPSRRCNHDHHSL